MIEINRNVIAREINVNFHAIFVAKQQKKKKSAEVYRIPRSMEKTAKEKEQRQGACPVVIFVSSVLRTR